MDNKVKKPGFGSVLMLFIVAMLGQFGVEVSPELASAGTGILALLIGWFVNR